MTGVGAAATADAHALGPVLPAPRHQALSTQPSLWAATVKVGCGHYPPNVARRPVGSSAPIPAVRATMAQPLEPTHNGRSLLPDGFGRACPAPSGRCPTLSRPQEGRTRRLNRRGSPRGRSCPPTSMKSHQPRHDPGRVKMGCLIGLLVSPQAALPIANLVYLPLSFAGR